MAERQIQDIVFTREDERGTLVEVIKSGSWESLAYGHMRAGTIMGQHYHKMTDVFFFLRVGKARIVTEDVQNGARDEFALIAGQGVIFPAMQSHAIQFQEDSDYFLMKSRAYQEDSPDTFEHEIAL